MPTNKQHLSSKDIIINITGNNYFYKSFFSVTTIYKDIKMDQTKNLKENSSLIQANEVIRLVISSAIIGGISHILAIHAVSGEERSA